MHPEEKTGNTPDMIGKSPRLNQNQEAYPLDPQNPHYEEEHTGLKQENLATCDTDVPDSKLSEVPISETSTPFWVKTNASVDLALVKAVNTYGP